MAFRRLDRLVAAEGVIVPTVNWYSVLVYVGDDVSPRKLLKSSKLKPFFSIPSLVRKCPDCDQQFANKTTLNIHRLKVRPYVDLFICVYVDKYIFPFLVFT